eukprot:gene37990-46882_t
MENLKGDGIEDMLASFRDKTPACWNGKEALSTTAETHKSTVRSEKRDKLNQNRRFGLINLCSDASESDSSDKEMSENIKKAKNRFKSIYKAPLSDDATSFSNQQSGDDQCEDQSAVPAIVKPSAAGKKKRKCTSTSAVSEESGSEDEGKEFEVLSSRKKRKVAASTSGKARRIGKQGKVVASTSGTARRTGKQGKVAASTSTRNALKTGKQGKVAASTSGTASEGMDVDDIDETDETDFIVDENGSSSPLTTENVAKLSHQEEAEDINALSTTSSNREDVVSTTSARSSSSADI